MMVITFETISGTDDAAIGMTQVSRYGTPQSPKFMRERGIAFLDAIGIRGKFGIKMVLGRELDATVVWEKSAPVVDPATGEERTYVNSRIVAERKAGSPKPPKANAKALSASALKYVEAQEGGSSTTSTAEPTGDRPEWEAEPTPTAASVTSSPAVEEWLSEDRVPAAANEYRVIIALGKANSEQAKRSLLGKRINPAGPIDVNALREPLKSEFAAWKSAQGGEDLPSLDGNGAAPTTARPKTGTRSKPATAA